MDKVTVNTCYFSQSNSIATFCELLYGCISLQGVMSLGTYASVHNVDVHVVLCPLTDVTGSHRTTDS